ncbi:hypothetical protein AB0F25_18830 [Streptomyces wedmorensis]|uniref:hypothetical protein n=1 Tax=Streptomyces wedmorensis TaxID=43759 RepID=UPI00343B72AF
MIEIISAVGGVAVAIGALVVSYLAHRHQVARATATGQAEAEQAARQAEAERRSVLNQASHIQARVAWRRSSLSDEERIAELRLFNHSSQPVTQLRAEIAGTPVPEASGSLAASQVRRFIVSRDAVDSADEALDVYFTDVAGLRWHRTARGLLRQGTLEESGEWSWGPYEAPLVFTQRVYQAGRNLDVQISPSAGRLYRRSRIPFLLPAILLVVAGWLILRWLT